MSACCPTCGLAPPSSTAVGLTAVQRRLLQYLEQRASAGESPTYAEMAHAMGLRSKSGIKRLVDGLEERGHIRRPINRWRSIVVLGNFPRRIAA